MCVGRLASILLSTRFLPSTLLCGSTLWCLVAALLLVLLAPHYAVSLYLGVALMGFFVSWQIGTGFSWTSHHLNITGRRSSVLFIGKLMLYFRMGVLYVEVKFFYQLGRTFFCVCVQSLHSLSIATEFSNNVSVRC